MDFLAGIGHLGSSVGFYLIPFLFVFTLIVFVHEMGHFLVARLCGVTIDMFSIGFGREVIGWTDRKGTRWKVGWLPLGGYVKFRGDANAASTPNNEMLANTPLAEREGLFFFKPVSQRAAVVAAGPIANFILAVAIFAGIFMFIGKVVATPIVDGVTPGSVAEAAGFKAGDRILSIDGSAIETFEDMQQTVGTSSGSDPLSFQVLRNGSEINIVATPRIEVEKDRFGHEQRIPRLGLQRAGNGKDIEIVRYDPFTSVWMGVKQVWFIVDITITKIGGMIAGKEDLSQIGGPLRTAEMSGQIASLGFSSLLMFVGFFSASIGLLNLFPVPILDGGHLLYYGVEAVRGRPMSEKNQEIGFRIGIALVTMLMLFSAWNDVVVRPVAYLKGLFS